MADLQKIVDDLSKLTVLEAADLAKMLEEKWGVSAAAAVVAAAAPGAAAAPVEEKTEFTVVLTAIGEKKIEVIKEVRALTALGHRAQAESSDFGLVVSVLYQNRAERPDQLAARLADEIAQRRALLTANEREVLENHLQAEIAAEVQKLLKAADLQVAAINTELHKRPTSTGVRYRLRWEPLVEGSDGAPVGLEAARRHLLHTNADLWSATDRRVIGTMLQQRILAERARAEAAEIGRAHV